MQDPWTEDMAVTLKNPDWVVTEVSIEEHVAYDVRGWRMPIWQRVPYSYSGVTGTVKTGSR